MVANDDVVKRPAHIDLTRSVHAPIQCIERNRLGLSGGSNRDSQRERNGKNCLANLFMLNP